MDDRSWRTLWSILTTQSGGGVRQHWIPETLDTFLRNQKVHVPPIELIPAKRVIDASSSDFKDYSGRGLLQKLAMIQSPDYTEREEAKKFERINRFLQTVTDKEEARIEVPYQRQHLLVHMDNKVLPLANLGMGIHEVVMLAAACTLTENSVVCMEEPEVHLHPLLQRKLIRYLQTETSNQYFVATHSASFIDTPNSAIFHVVNDGAMTRIRETVLRSERFEICRDLGVRASDLVQANSVIWVEGPSDRVYLKHWIRAEAPDLTEGIHYSIMFYGGRLLSHLSATDEEVTEFIQLKGLNRHLAILVDSDKASAGDKINETKKRVQAEFVLPAVCWITAGREIENYIDPSALAAAVQKVHPQGYHEQVSRGAAFSHALHFRRYAKEQADPTSNASPR